MIQQKVCMNSLNVMANLDVITLNLQYLILGIDTIKKTMIKVGILKGQNTEQTSNDSKDKIRDDVQ